MNQNTKTVALTLLATTIVAAGATFASDVSTSGTGSMNGFGYKHELTAEQKAQFDAIKTILEKKKAGTALTTDEQAQLDKFEANKPEMGKRGFGGHRGGMGEGFGGFQMQLTDAEKTQLKTMTDAEKKTFFETKRTEFEAKQTAQDTVIDKLLAGQTLTADEESLRAEIIKQRADMKAKREEMKTMQTIMEKKRNGQTLTTDEQAQLDKFEANKPNMEETK